MTCSSSSSTSPTPEDAQAAVAAAVGRFGRIDVLVNNAGNFYAGFFEELSPDDFRAQIETNLFGPMNVTRAVLPVMRAQRRGLIVTISSTGGITGQAFISAYSAAKFGVEGWMESLAPEVAPFGIRTMLVEPGFFRTELLTPESTKLRQAVDRRLRREDTKQTVAAWKQNERPARRRPRQARQGADPARRLTTSRRCAGPPAPTPSASSRRKPRVARPGRRLPRTVVLARPRRRYLTTTATGQHRKLSAAIAETGTC